MVSATSDLGPEFEGEAILEVPRNNPVWAAMVPPPEVILLEVRALCDEFRRGRFVVVGSEGPLLSPASAFTLNRGWNPPADISYGEAMATVEDPRDFTPAQGMVMRPDGLIDFVSYSNTLPALPQAPCDPNLASQGQWTSEPVNRPAYPRSRGGHDWGEFTSLSKRPWSHHRQRSQSQGANREAGCRMEKSQTGQRPLKMGWSNRDNRCSGVSWESNHRIQASPESGAIHTSWAGDPGEARTGAWDVIAGQ